MGLPPGPLFLCRSTLQTLPRLIIWYAMLHLFVFYTEIAVPTWLSILVVLSTQLMFLFVVGRVKAYREQDDAAANEAVFVPQVQEGGISTVNKLVKSVTSGYPSERFQSTFSEQPTSDIFCSRCDASLARTIRRNIQSQSGH